MHTLSTIIANNILSKLHFCLKQHATLIHKVIAVRLKNITQTICFQFTTTQIVLLSAPLPKADLILSIKPALPLKTSDIQFEGKLEIAKALNSFLQQAKTHWQKILTDLLGEDFGLHLIAFLEILNEKIPESFQSTYFNLPTQPEVDNFLNGVDTLKEDLDRLIAKIKCYHQTILQ